MICLCRQILTEYEYHMNNYSIRRISHTQDNYEPTVGRARIAEQNIVVIASWLVSVCNIPYN